MLTEKVLKCGDDIHDRAQRDASICDGLTYPATVCHALASLEQKGLVNADGLRHVVCFGAAAAERRVIDKTNYFGLIDQYVCAKRQLAAAATGNAKAEREAQSLPMVQLHFAGPECMVSTSSRDVTVSRDGSVQPVQMQGADKKHKALFYQVKAPNVAQKFFRL